MVLVSASFCCPVSPVGTPICSRENILLFTIHHFLLSSHFILEAFGNLIECSPNLRLLLLLGRFGEVGVFSYMIDDFPKNFS